MVSNHKDTTNLELLPEINQLKEALRRSLLVSQWSVSDSDTKELMVAFYERYLEHGNKAIALQQAMQRMRSGLSPSKPTQSDYRHPRYWAAFVVVGAEV